ncbi:MAG TPA: hypothetical protein VFD37_07740, partial [Solirubrobacterales bacterium]|nr:hypothetical protein [Solirubrobacterales bacterium]
EICYLDWRVTPFRADRFLDIWQPAAAKAMAYGAQRWALTRSTEDPLLIRQESAWKSRADFESYWYSEEISRVRTEIIDLYGKPILPVWHQLLATG